MKTSRILAGNKETTGKNIHERLFEEGKNHKKINSVITNFVFLRSLH